jgi:hypothetical protein
MTFENRCDKILSKITMEERGYDIFLNLSLRLWNVVNKAEFYFPQSICKCWDSKKKTANNWHFFCKC